MKKQNNKTVFPLSLTVFFIFAGLSATACGHSQKHIGFDYSCFEECKKGREHNRDCVMECTEKQSISGQRK
jgi:hypothetical protein